MLGRRVGTAAATHWQFALDAKIGSTDLSRQLERVKEDFATQRRQLGELRQRLAAQTTAKRTFQRAQDLLKNFWALYESASYEDRRELIAALVRALGGATATKEGIIRKRQPIAADTSG